MDRYELSRCEAESAADDLIAAMEQANGRCPECGDALGYEVDGVLYCIHAERCGCDCHGAFHRWVKGSAERFKANTKIVGEQHFEADALGPALHFLLGNCPGCNTTLAIELEVQ